MAARDSPFDMQIKLLMIGDSGKIHSPYIFNQLKAYSLIFTLNFVFIP